MEANSQRAPFWGSPSCSGQMQEIRKNAFAVARSFVLRSSLNSQLSSLYSALSPHHTMKFIAVLLALYAMCASAFIAPSAVGELL